MKRVQPALTGTASFELLDDTGQPIAVVSAFLSQLAARGYSPNTLSAYAYDLLHFLRFLAQKDLTYLDFTPARSLELLEFLRALPANKPTQRLSIVLCTSKDG